MNVYAITAAATPSPIPEVEAPKPTPTSTYLGCYEDNSRNRIMTESTVDLELTNEVSCDTEIARILPCSSLFTLVQVHLLYCTGDEGEWS